MKDYWHSGSAAQISLHFDEILDISNLIFFNRISDIFNIDIKGPLNGSTLTRRVKNFGESFDIHFDLILHEKRETSRCNSILYVKYNEDLEGKDFEEKASIYVCNDNRLAFEVTKKNNSHTASNFYRGSPNVEYHIQYKQFRQHDYNGELKRFVKIDNKIVLDRQINSTLVSDVTIHINDADPYGSISNFKMSK